MTIVENWNSWQGGLLLQILNKEKKGIALVLVLTFAICVMVFVVSMILFRKESKQQNLTNVHFLQANFLAQSAIQMMTLKMALFPQEAADAGVFSLGYCPFRGILPDAIITDKNDPTAREVLNIFKDDCNTTDFQWITEDITLEDWKFEITDFKVVSAYTNPSKMQMVLLSQMVAIGEANMSKGGMGTRKEEMTKTIKLSRQN